MDATKVLEQLDLGTSVAENDPNLTKYFIQTVTLHDFLDDRYDLVRGAKGSGKSALLKVIAEDQAGYPVLSDVGILVATEHTGEPAFKRAFEFVRLGEVKEPDLVSAWKTYLLNLALDKLEQLPRTGVAEDAIKFAESCDLRYRTTSPFKKIWWSLLRMLHPKSFTLGTDSIAVEFPDLPPEFWTEAGKMPDFPEALDRCVAAFKEARVRCWLLIDRLDAAFQHDRRLEEVALRSLLVAYKDFMGHPYLRPKIFLRTDLYEVVTMSAGFRELTHVADRTSPPIGWDPDRLLQMIMERFAFNGPVCDAYRFDRAAIEDPAVREAAFYSVFPDQVDSGTRKPDTWTWMLARIRDGNGVRTPRDLLTLVRNAAQRERALLERAARATPELISSAALKQGLGELSKDKIDNALIAENHELKTAIEAFEKAKAEQNADTLQALLGAEWEAAVEQLVRIGFLEKIGDTWKVPMLYRSGLQITQGAAFQKSGGEGDVDESDEA